MTTDRATRNLPPLTARAHLRWALIEPIVAGLAPVDLLEIGCGQGAVGVRLAGMTEHLTVVEPDDASFAVASARIVAAGGTAVHGDHTALPPDARFDLVCSFEVLEHIEDDAASLADWVTLVRPGGHLLLSTPSGRMGPSDVAVGHFRRYSVSQMRALLAEVGLVDIDVRLHGWPLGYVLDFVRHAAVRRRGRRVTSQSMAERTGTSGRMFQPTGAVTGAAMRWGTRPFVAMQRFVPQRGTALVALARRPDVRP